MVTKKKQYSEDSIDVLSGIEGFRMAPTMYLGELGDAMVFRMVKEVADNVYDEFSSGRNKYMEVCFCTKTNTYLVADAAQGIPVGFKTVDGKKLSTLTAVFTRAHAGGKFRSAAYKTSAGTHGIGVAAVNAVSKTLTVWTKREGQWWMQCFEAGKPKTEHPVKCKGPTPKLKLQRAVKDYGTVVEFTPDQSVVSIDATRGKKIANPTVARLDPAHSMNWLRDMAMLNPGFHIAVHDGKKLHTFVNKDGLDSIVQTKLDAHELTPVNKKPIIYKDDYLSFGISWANTADADLFSSYVNTSPTADHGSHVKGFTDALARAVKEHATAKDKYKQSDLLAGAVGFLNWKMHGAQYSSQIKDKLVSNVAKDVEETAFKVLHAAFKSNAKLAKDIIKRAVMLGKGREDLANVIRSVGEVKKKGRGAFLPDILTMCPDAKPEERELYLVEGDSAGGCFSGDTEVLLADGSTIRYDEMVERHERGEVFVGLSYDIETGQYEPQQFVEPRVVKRTQHLVEVTLSNGVVRLCTPDHPWLAGDKYVAAQDLVEGAELTNFYAP